MSARPVELFVDPVCPFAWMTSRWLLQAAMVRDIAPTYSVMSLSVLNEGRDLDADYRRMLDDSWGPARLAVEIVSTHGSEAFARWYTAWGEQYHVGGQQDDRRAVAVAALETAELPAELIDVYEPVVGDATDVALRASHDGAISRVGDEVGTPVISFGDAGTAPSGTAQSGTAQSGTALSGTAQSGTAPSGTALSGTAQSGTALSGTAYFGPVVSPAPKGEDAGRLLDALETLSSLDGFYELKRSRTGGIDFS